MTKRFVFRLPEGSKDNIIHGFNLKERLSNERTSIYENKDMRFSIDKKIVRVIIFNGDDYELQNKIQKYFYGGNYETVR